MCGSFTFNTATAATYTAGGDSVPAPTHSRIIVGRTRRLQNTEICGCVLCCCGQLRALLIVGCSTNTKPPEAFERVCKEGTEGGRVQAAPSAEYRVWHKVC
jgi:hypothetical protein